MANVEARLMMDLKTGLPVKDWLGDLTFEIRCSVCKDFAEAQANDLCPACGEFVCRESDKVDSILGCVRVGCSCQRTAHDIYPALAARVDSADVSTDAKVDLLEKLCGALAMRVQSRRWKGLQIARSR